MASLRYADFSSCSVLTICSLLLRISCNAHHCGAQQSVFQAVTALQLGDDVVVLGIARVHHLDSFMDLRIENRPFSFDRSDAKPSQSVEHLLANEFDAGPQLLLAAVVRNCQCAIKAIEDRQELLQRVTNGVLAEFLLLARRALAEVIELSLLTGQAVIEGIAFRLSFLQLRLCRRWSRRCFRSASFSGRQLVIYVERGAARFCFGFSITFIHWNLHWMTVVPHRFISAGLIPLV